MEPTLYTNDNLAFEAMYECVNVQYLDGETKDKVDDIFIYDHSLLPEGHGDEVRFTLPELHSLRPTWGQWLLDRLTDDGKSQLHNHYLFDGYRYYDVLYDTKTRDILFEKSYCWPEHFRPNDLIFVGKRTHYNSLSEIRRLLKIPQMVHDINKEFYYELDLGCPLSHWDLQQSLRHAFRKLIEKEDSMET